MQITLTWDLFIIVFFAVIMTYSFIIGKKESVKVIIATYISVICVQGLGNLITRLSGPNGSLLESVGYTIDMTILSSLKLVLLIAAIVILAIRAGFDVHYTHENSAAINGIITGLFGFATAGLLLSTLLTYIAGLPLLDVTIAQTQMLSPIMQQSQLMQIMVLYQDIWFVLPAFLLVGAGFLNNK